MTKAELVVKIRELADEVAVMGDSELDSATIDTLTDLIGSVVSEAKDITEGVSSAYSSVDSADDYCKEAMRTIERLDTDDLESAVSDLKSALNDLKVKPE